MLNVRQKGNREERRLVTKIRGVLGQAGAKRTGFIAGERDVAIQTNGRSFRLESKREEGVLHWTRKLLDKVMVPTDIGVIEMRDTGYLLCRGNVLWFLFRPTDVRATIDVYTGEFDTPTGVSKRILNASILWHRMNRESDDNAIVFIKDRDTLNSINPMIEIGHDIEVRGISQHKREAVERGKAKT